MACTRKLYLSILLLAINSNVVISRDILRERNNTTFIFPPHHWGEMNGPTVDNPVEVFYGICGKSVKHTECVIYSRSFRKWKTLDPEFLCKFALDLGPNSNGDEEIEFISLAPYDYKSVVLKWLELRDGIVTTARYTFLSRTMYPLERKDLSFPIGLAKNDSNFLNDFYFDDDEMDGHFIVSSKEACNGAEKCEIIFDRRRLINYTSFNKHNWNYSRHDDEDNALQLKELVHLNSKLKNEVIQGTGDKNETNYFIHGNDPLTGQFKLQYLSSNGTLSNLLTLRPNTDVVVSSFVRYSILAKEYDPIVCHVADRTLNTTKVNFRQFYKKDGSTRHNYNVEIQRAVKLISVTEIGFFKAMIVAEKIGCVGDECWNLTVSFVSNIFGSTETYDIKFDCTGERKDIVFYHDPLDSSEVMYYGCERLVEQDDTRSYFQVRRFLPSQYPCTEYNSSSEQ